MKLEIKHLAPYLPYELKCFYKLSNIEELESFVDPKNLPYKGYIGELSLESMASIHIFEEVKPILKPLSSLPSHEIVEWIDDLDPIILEGYNYVNNGNEISVYTPTRKFFIAWENQLVPKCYTFIYQKLIENHYDIYGLIDAGLAVDYYEVMK